ncbi:MAG: response regulator transcription factor [Bacteroidales bacterium]|nr:response regulator transcription factor [Bacteroidales bacterium]
MKKIETIVIIEDEEIAAHHLQRLLSEEIPDARVVAILQSIEESVEYLQQNSHPDLVFMDIHLADGLSFRIFDTVDIPCPIVFTTAYDQYALDAFKVNSLDYLLKPISREALHHTIEKFTTALRYIGHDSHNTHTADVVRQMSTHYKSHFLIPMRDKLIPIDVSKIACLYLEDKITRAIFFDGHQQIVDRPLDIIMEQLDPTRFFRANRQYIVSHPAIQEISIWPISKLALTLSVPTPERIIISKARVPEFKQWYTA